MPVHVQNLNPASEFGHDPAVNKVKHESDPLYINSMTLDSIGACVYVIKQCVSECAQHVCVFVCLCVSLSVSVCVCL